ncbi:hypothetical protein BH708_01020 [Brachybacterium sp. P6-10-X1]|uniref:hypothetical protein n=1 Tax=Brachybacterium sp. P6-10-X1 TaxID=1903186 RepID=UPI000971955F|nr:hypothetical protein [Brachybacterium sp. P6-10-X1]APX31542.1 hypothetical protein BH708_01020 [Brachybacterium sp. P6-10-X1]
MESINLGAVLFGLLLLLWVAYALPRTARRRDVMGRARTTELTEMTSEARDLSEAVHTRRSSREVNAAMSQDRLLLRPADPTSRPRFDAVPGARIDVLEERARSRRVMRAVLALLAGVTLALIGLALAQVIAGWVPLIGVAGLAAYLVGLRRAELERRARTTRTATRARQERAERETARRADAARTAAPVAEPEAPHAPPEAPGRRERLETTTERAAHQVSAPGEWMPRPVPRPTYTLRGEVDDLASRHAAHRRSMQATSVPLESEGVEELEAADESYAPAQDLQLDEILARRRA